MYAVCFVSAKACDTGTTLKHHAKDLVVIPHEYYGRSKRGEWAIRTKWFIVAEVSVPLKKSGYIRRT